jgi:SIR2-like domain
MRVPAKSEKVGPRKPRIVLFLGSGFSAAFGLPTTTLLGSMLLDQPNGLHHVPEIEKFITKHIADYWKKVFGWTGRQGPALEDQFTQIDLAANSGHHLGSNYGPKQLRAIRRITIHRVFSLLESSGAQVPCVHKFLRDMCGRFDLTIVTTNWDTEAEWNLDLLGIPFNYGVDVITRSGRNPPVDGIPVLKLHGSTNHGYCDTCRMLVNFGDQVVNAAVSLKLLLEPSDFSLLRRKDLARKLERDRLNTITRTCGCGGRIGARVGTFSYRKDLNPHAFYTIWDKAASSLQMANSWLFVGYSLPEADIEIRHMLKWTQLAHEDGSEPFINVVLREDTKAGERYEQFFGIDNRQVFQYGFDEWVTGHLDSYCK